MVEVKFVWPADVLEIWGDVEGYLRKANEYGDGRTPMHIWLARVLSGSADLFVASDMSGAAICEVLIYPTKKTYLVSLYGGEIGMDHKIFRTKFEEVARKLGCSQLETRCRAGWEKLFKSWNYRFLYSQWAADL